jgi:hypothetical protein
MAYTGSGQATDGCPKTKSSGEGQDGRARNQAKGEQSYRQERANRSKPVSVTGDGSSQAECGKEHANGQNEGAEKTKRWRDHREPVEHLRQPEI